MENIQRELPSISQRPSIRKTATKIFLSGNFPAEPATRRLPPAFHGVRPSHGPITFPHCKQRSTLFEIIEPLLLRGPRKRKNLNQRVCLFREIREATREPTDRETRTITNKARRSKTRSTPCYKRCRLWVFCGRLICVLSGFLFKGISAAFYKSRYRTSPEN